MSQHLTPLAVVERLVAPLAELGAIVGTHPKSPYHWPHGSAWRDPGDLPPRVNRALLDYAERHGIPLTAEHLIRGADLDEIETLLAERRMAGMAAQ